MNYNVLIDLAILGGAVCILAMLTFRLDRPKRGATPEPDRQKLKDHQAVRRILMKDGEFK